MRNVLNRFVILSLVAAFLPYPARAMSDNFAGRPSLTGASAQDSGSNLGASREVGEPTETGSRTLWTQWTAPANGRVTLLTDGSDTTFSKNLSVFIGTSLTTLSSVANATEQKTPSVSFPVTTGRVYTIALGSYFSDQGGNMILTVSLDSNDDVSQLNLPTPAAVENDLFAQRISLPGSSVSAIGYNGSATREVGEPADTGYRTLWWSWTAPANGRVTILTDGSDTFSKNLSALIGLRWVASSRDAKAPSITFPVTAGRTYSIAVGSYFDDTAGSIVLTINLATNDDISQLNLTTPAAVENDLFADAIPLAGATVSAIGYNGSATRDVGEPSDTGSLTLWWSWTAPANGQVNIVTTGSDNFSKNLKVFTGTSLTALSEIASDTDHAEPSVHFTGIAGQVYRIAVGSYFSDVWGSTVLTINGPQGSGGGPGSCVASGQTLCIDDQTGDDRFRIQVAFDTGQQNGQGQAIPLSNLGVGHGGLFWFFSADNPEMLIKVINGCAVNNRYWLFYAATTNVGLTVTVTDTHTGTVKTYTNHNGTAALPIQDTSAFPCS
jgi:hypothetical protein